MIYCPTCGTGNRDGSKFCNECGGRLPEPPPEPSAPPPGVPDLTGLLPEEAALLAAELMVPGAPEPSPLTPRRGSGVRAEAPSEEEAEALEAPPEELLPEPPGAEAPPEPSGPPPSLPSSTRGWGPPVEPTEAEEPGELRLSALGLAEDLSQPLPPERKPKVLAGVSEPIPIAPIISQPHPASPMSQPIPALAEIQEAKLLEQLLITEPTPRGEAGVTPARRWVPVLRRLTITILVAAAVIAPLLVPSGWSWLLLGSSPDVSRVYQAIEDLPAGTPVLVAFDYTPATAGELDPQARALVRHLLSRGLPVVTVSLVPEGPALAGPILAQEMAAYPEARYGRAHVDLGYLTGGEAALRALAAGLPAAVPVDYLAGLPLGELPATAGVTGLDDLGLIVVLAGDSEPVRWWVEQVGVRTQTPLAAGVSAAIEPQLRPYRDSGQLAGLISGLPGAARYAALTGAGADWAGRLDALSLSLLAFIVLIVVGNLASWLTRGR